MTHLLEKAFQEASKLSPEEQDALASIVLAELESEGAWDKAFRDSQDVLAKLGRDALAEDAQGHTKELDPSNL